MSNVLNDVLNMYFFEAATDVKTHIAPSTAAVQFLQENPDITLDLLRRVYRGTDGLLRRMAHLMGGDAKHRLVFEIVNTGYRFGELQEDGSLHLAFSESELGRLSGLTRETVSRTLKTLKAAGLLKVTRRGISVTNMQRLEALLGDAV